MKWLQIESRRYALLLVVLLAIAAVAVGVTITYLQEIIPERKELLVATVVIWILTMGFMLIAGAFGLWAVHFAAETESLRRLSSLVDAMDYIHDPVLALTREGKAVGLNPAAISVFGASARDQRLSDLLPDISDTNVSEFLHNECPVEAETEFRENGTSRTLRLRSQPSKGIIILLISDVTDLVRNRERSRRTAYVQLIGHMANGVANDFNDLLCGIAGHAALLIRQHNINSVNIKASAESIQDCAERGMLRARQLMELTIRGPEQATATIQTALHVQAGIDLLRSSLSADWTITQSIATNILPVNIPPVQLEHLVQSLGLVTADASPSARNMSIDLSPAIKAGQNGNIAALLTISTSVDTAVASGHFNQSPLNENSGIVIAVMEALIGQAGGKVQKFDTADGGSAHRILLPVADTAALITESPETLSSGLEAYASGWHILIDRQMEKGDASTDHFQRAGIHARSARGITHLLSAIENDNRLDAIALSYSTLGEDRTSLLKAISKLTPKAGIVVQRDDGHDDGIPGVLYVPLTVSHGQLLQTLIEARSQMRAIQNTQH